jgi:hypothetical protein
MVTRDQLAHDLAIVYLNNRYGADVSGRFTVRTLNGEVTGSGSVETKRAPEVNKVLIERVPTGEKRFGIFDKTVPIEAGYEVDATFTKIVEDYFLARDRFFDLLHTHFAPTPPAP